MTNELEKTFFHTFGIEPIDYKGCSWGGYCPHEEHIDCGECSYWETWKVDYPQISDRILLWLICIANKAYIDLEGTDIETMKNSLLENFIFFRRDVYDQVRTLFEEEK